MADETTPNEGSRLTARTVVLGLLVIAALTFVLQNRGSENFKFLFLSFTMPKWLMFIVLIAVGMAIDRLVIWISNRRASKAS